MTKPVAIHTTTEIATKTMQAAKAAAAAGMIIEAEPEGLVATPAEAA
jgi:hypothetical protein